MADSAHLFTALFLFALVVSVALQSWLALRQMRHVTAHRDSVPSHFEGRISLASHQKAADYTVARTRLSMADTMLEVLVLLALTLGGGLAWLASRVGVLDVSPLLKD